MDLEERVPMMNPNKNSFENNVINPETGDGEPKTTKNKFERILGSLPNFFEHIKMMRAQQNEQRGANAEIQQNLKQNSRLQSIYDSAISAELEDWEMQDKFREFNMSEETPFLASGQSSYFNEQIDRDGMSGLKLREQDVEDARFVADCFGKKASFSDDNLDILYATLPGTTEMNYATQTFPAIVFEDVFQCSVDHELPFSPKVGEKEEDYWSRVLDVKIAEEKDFPREKIEEAKNRGARLAKNFCGGKNRVYLVPIKSVLGNKASFGDIMGIRGGESEDGGTTEKAISEARSLEELMTDYGQSPNNVSGFYSDPNFASEYGIAIYGKIPLDGMQYIEVERGYDTMQRKARQGGLRDGEEIDLGR